MGITFLSLTCFALDAEDIGERLNLAVTILLTLVAFQHTVFAKLPNIPYLTFMHKYIIISFIFVCTVILESSFVPIVSGHDYETDEQNGNDFVEKHVEIPFDVGMSWLFGLFWIGYHLFFIFRSGWNAYRQSKKLKMDSDQIAEQVEEKYPQFLFSWKSFRDIMDSHGGSVDKWAKTESILEEEHVKKVMEEEEQQKREKNKKYKLREKKARCVMEFGGDSGQILTFVSYAQKMEKSDLSFWGYIGQIFTHCCKNLFGLICCECCRHRETSREVKRNKSRAYDSK